MPKWLEGALVILGISVATAFVWVLLLGEIDKQRKMFPGCTLGGVRQADGTWKCGHHPSSPGGEG